ncbi:MULTISPECIES: STAS domain-containing protein [unclassified Streptomyces]|uniref:STAS domain-containing protein n=1 Tax=unclassified Streptomyces TaxID=2593676 RepID=UPI0022452378|nr:STAS domain-containing protein [Streptomyces sp. SKN60]MCX2180940.1 STAS domain-containing protein [Streptomyces sp. SKN60]
MTIQVDEDRQEPWTVLRISGELDLVTSPLIRRRLHEAVAGGRHDVVLDLSAVRFCDSSGVGVLVAARRLMRSCGGRLRLILPARGAEDGAHVNRVLAALGVRRLFEVYADVPAALDDTAAPLSA